MKFNQRGQSALEYLMTYGWALVVIVVVVAALVLLVGPQNTGDTCSVSGSGITVSNQNLTAAAGWELRVTNATGRAMTATADVSTTWDDATVVANADGFTDTTTYTAGQAMTVTDDPALALTTDKRYNTVFTFAWDDPDGFARTATVNCAGTAD